MRAGRRQVGLARQVPQRQGSLAIGQREQQAPAHLDRLNSTLLLVFLCRGFFEGATAHGVSLLHPRILPTANEFANGKASASLLQPLPARLYLGKTPSLHRANVFDKDKSLP